jgi:hypothetical protein
LEQINLRHHFSRNTLMLMCLLALVVIGVLAWQQDLVRTVYFTNQLTTLGLVVNGAILALFLVGILRMAQIFAGYIKEENALARFVRNLGRNDDDLLDGVQINSIIARRYLNMRHLYELRTPIDQNALAATLVARESTRTSLPRFINNTLILTGVFGTILSLSIALLGAADLLGNSVDVHGMGLVVHGMSTALSTTITAILCFLFFGYFHLKLNDAQTNLVSGVEEVTATWLLPRFQVKSENVLHQFTGLIDALREALGRMETVQKGMAASQEDVVGALDTYQQAHVRASYELSNINDVLKRGFRLQDEA